MAIELKHQTAAQFAARFWQRVQRAYAAGDKYEWHRLIWWLWRRVTDGDITNDGARLSFNDAFGRSLNSTQWDAFVQTKLVPIKDRYLVMLAEEDL